MAFYFDLSAFHLENHKAKAAIIADGGKYIKVNGHTGR
ncbi:hypothetical protein BSM4216_0180 [Bacillus smithii]|jgi:hypothetical protein|nr:hypothetical protein BSM4216_0180 [Bacillus smithii]